MNNIKNTLIDFEMNCTTLDLSIEYGPNKVGKEKYAIITDLTEKELEEKYSSILDEFRPFVVLTKEMGEVIYDYHRNEEKHKKRMQRSGHIFDANDGLLETLHLEVACVDEPTKELEKKELFACIEESFKFLTEKERKRFIQYCLKEIPISKIAAEEKVSEQNIHKSIMSALAKVQNYLREKGWIE